MSVPTYMNDPSVVISTTEWETPLGVLRAEALLENNTIILLRDAEGIAIVDTWPDFAYHHPRKISQSTQKRWGTGWDFRCLIAQINDDIVLPEGAEIGWNDGNDSLIILTECGLATYKNLCKNPKLSGQRPGMVMQKIHPGFLTHSNVYVPDKREFAEIEKILSSWWEPSTDHGCKIKINEPGWHLSRGETVVICENEKKYRGWYFWSTFAESKWFLPVE